MEGFWTEFIPGLIIKLIALGAIAGLVCWVINRFSKSKNEDKEK